MVNKILFLALFVVSVAQGTTTTVPNGCKDLEDGTYDVKFLRGDDYPTVSVKCSNGYAILDYNLDNNIKDYFVSWHQWHYHSVGPTNEDDSKSLKWTNWFIPGQYDANMKYLISPDCTVCDESNVRQLYSTQTTYWMTGGLFGCRWTVKAQTNCDIDIDEDVCYKCAAEFGADGGSSRSAITDSSTAEDYLSTGLCPYNVQMASRQTVLTHDDCSDITSLKPSLGIEGKYCVCVQSSHTTSFEVDTAELPSSKDTTQDETDEDNAGVVYLYQEDFADGTYRITKPGNYYIMEDIVFNFNPNEETPNSNYAWMPTTDQADKYPGAGDYQDAYFMGFFAGITIEASDVVLDLQGHTLQMSEHFYYQQRWFTTIELSSQYFVPGQGIGNFGGNHQIAGNVIIRNGTLGLTSHHGIHGNYNKNIVIQDIKVQNFETHGMQFNGFSDITLRNVEVGPISNIAYFKGEYGHARYFLPRFTNIANEDGGDRKIQFYGRDEPTTMAEIVEKLTKELDFAYNYVVNGVELTETDEDYDLFVEGKHLFVNENGIPNGAAQYGIFLNTFGASVFTYSLYASFLSSRATLENVQIHGMKHSMLEYVRLHTEKVNIIANPFAAPLDAEEIFDDVESDSPTYRGNPMTDGLLASNYLSDNWGYLQLQYVQNDITVPWAMGTDLDALANKEYVLGCNNDVMVHSGKGINGLRLDGVEDITIKNLKVYDLEDYTPIGRETCGEYESFTITDDSKKAGGHFRQTVPMQIGFSGNMVQAVNINAATSVTLEDITIYDLTSETGPTFGISIWPACDVELRGDINVYGLTAGSKIEQDTYSYSDRPNKAPEACGVRLYSEYDGYTTTVTSTDANIQVSNIVGHVGCLGESEYTMFGDVIDADTSSMAKYSKLGFNTIVSYIPKQTVVNIIIEMGIFMSIVAICYYFSSQRYSNIRKGYQIVTSQANYGSI